MSRPVVQSPIETEERKPDETNGEYTDRLVALGSALGINRQCSIGWHYECSDPAGDTCRCACHPERVARRAIPLPEEPGYYVGYEGDVWQLAEDGVWWFGADDRADPRDASPLQPLILLSSEERTVIATLLRMHALELSDRALIAERRALASRIEASR